MHSSPTLLSFKPSARACCWADLWGLHNMASLTYSTWLGLDTKHRCPWGLLSITDPSWCHFNTHKSNYCSQVHHVFQTVVGNTLYRCNWLCCDTLFHSCNEVLHWPALHFNLTAKSTRQMLVRKHHIGGKFVITFKKVLSISGAPI